ncbi:unnamed protein product [Ambrosiozyma monospora]|uniref:Unnamed protein product n=1 Tax=Ambrosiozyma monospora TaxID=43982 RepID=A0ACB5TQ23_AMBMO|nr:unnamed protein product [Ambrosiozyma monospora]
MRETVIIWSKKTGRPLYNGVVWNDTRTLDHVNHLQADTPEDIKDDLKKRTGCPISTYFSAFKWKWLYENVPAIKASYDSGDKDLMFGTVDTWLIYNLTREKSFVTDMSNASRTYLMNLETRDYDDVLLNFSNIDKSKINLPKIVPSSYQFGSFSFPDIKKLGYAHSHVDQDQLVLLKRQFEGVPITGCLGDQSSSLVGQMAFRRGDAKCTYGTGAFLLYNTGSEKLISEHGAVTTVGYWFDHLDPKVDGEQCYQPQFCLEGSIAVAGSCIQWLRDNLKLIDKASDIGPLAATAKTSGGVVFVPAFSGLFAPYWDSKTTGTIFGLTQYSTAAHIARAAIEGVCFQVRAILQAMISDAGQSSDFLDIDDDNSCPIGGGLLRTLHVDGGMSKSNTVMQIQADFLGHCVTVARSPNAECTAFGAAIAAGIHPDVGVYESLKDVEKAVSESESYKGGAASFCATMKNKERKKALKLWQRAVERAMHWLEPVSDDDDEE